MFSEVEPLILRRRNLGTYLQTRYTQLDGFLHFNFAKILYLKRTPGDVLIK